MGPPTVQLVNISSGMVFSLFSFPLYMKKATIIQGKGWGRVRPPLNEISEAKKAELENDLRQVGLLGGKQ
jgi:dihydrodipicolinate synthase/N-acetylneuraminate lyase